MIIMAISSEYHFSKETIERISKENSENYLLRNARLKAFELFEKLPMPDFKYGLSIKLDVQDLDISKINLHEHLHRSNIKIKADKKIIVEDLNNAITTIPEVKNQFMRSIVIANKPDAMAAAFWQVGKVIYVPKNTILKEPIVITSDVETNTLMEYLLVVVESSCDVSIVEDISSKEKGKHSYSGKLVEVVVKDNSIVHYTSVQNLSRDFFNFVNKRAVVGANSTINWLDCCLGTRFTKSDISTVLKGQGAVTNNYGIFFGTGSQQFDLRAATIHAERNTICDMWTKGALNDRAKTLYSGLIKINSNAAGSNGYQKEDTLLLSPDAEADSIPELEIDNNEVKCTHGATVGQVDKEKLFYLMSRGLPENLAKKQIVTGFFEPMVEKISVEHLKEKLREIVSDKIEIK